MDEGVDEGEGMNMANEASEYVRRLIRILAQQERLGDKVLEAARGHWGDARYPAADKRFREASLCYREACRESAKAKRIARLAMRKAFRKAQ